MAETEQKNKISFFSKEPIICPVCEAKFHREEVLTGRGRLIAGNLTDELRRIYEPSKKYGEIFPLIYSVTVCPSCFYAALDKHFPELPLEKADPIREDSVKRKESAEKLFGPLDFTEPRGLVEGAASYYLAVECYDHFPPDMSPTISQGLCCLRAAWICRDLDRKYSDENWDYVGLVFYRKAAFFYRRAVALEQQGKESIGNLSIPGPDLDKNYGYDGILYLASYLELFYGPQKDQEKRKQRLDYAKRTVARIFGMGRASKNKPAVLLEKAKELYSRINTELGIKQEQK